MHRFQREVSPPGKRTNLQQSRCHKAYLISSFSASTTWQAETLTVRSEDADPLRLGCTLGAHPKKVSDILVVIADGACLGFSSFKTVSMSSLKGYGFCHPSLMLPPGKSDKLSINTLPGSARRMATSPLKSVVLGIMSVENFLQVPLMPSKVDTAYTFLESWDLNTTFTCKQEST